ncbi:MAG: glucosaminidase domain-containing protein [Chitinophagaceae bacterium]|nr:glucosaminidase domain-containing protein [Chitinophagaceae bacterium]
MRRFTFLIGLLSAVLNSFAQDPQDVQAYIDKYKNLAVREQIRVGIPAAVTLAQGIHESAAGKSELATIGNNHFGIKCKSTWEGETMAHDDDAKQECFRKYPSSEHSYIDHSDYLKSSNRYHFLFDLELTDYHGWTSGLKRAGYATNPAYVRRLDEVIEKYNLQQYTYEGIQQANKTTGEIIPENDKPIKEPTPANSSISVNNNDPKTYYKGLKGFWAHKDDQLLNMANEKNIRYAKLLALNDLDDAPLENDMFIFIEKNEK